MVIHFFEGAHKVERGEMKCEECGAYKLIVDFRKVSVSLFMNIVSNIGSKHKC